MLIKAILTYYKKLLRDDCKIHNIMQALLYYSYVDSYRMMSVHMGTENDLKQVMQRKGMKVS